VYEHQRRAVFIRKRGDAVINLVPHLVRCNRSKRAGRNFYGKIKLALVADVDDHRIGSSAAGEKVCNLLDRLLGGGKPDAPKASSFRWHSEGLQPRGKCPWRTRSLRNQCFQSLQ